jgi:pyrimidine-nucleoside phosphorylase
MVDLILKKQAGHTLTKEEIRFVISGFTDGTIPDYQMSALAMAIYFKDMDDRERAELTMAMVHSGDQIDLSKIEGIKVDKHSTGGVGDTTSLILAPMVAALGIPVAKMSGRGLGHTGGTLDKLESFPGFHVEVSSEEFVELVNKNKIALIGQSGNITPADKKLYSLRDVTGTVQSIPLIASSIMSKKIAAGADAIVLDVKTGAGAFMKTVDDARDLATAMVAIGNKVGRKTMAVISDMSQPLGFAIGNALEVKEAIDTLNGHGPEDLTELVFELGSKMVILAGKAETEEKARQMLQEVIDNGKALEVFKTFIENQGGDPSYIMNPEKLPKAKFITEFKADKDGYVSELVADEIGKAAMLLGAGRETKDSVIDLAVGLVLNKKVGDAVKTGDVLLYIHHSHDDIDSCIKLLRESVKISSDTVVAPILVHEVVQ